MGNGVQIWWTAISIVAVLNILAWGYSAAQLFRKKPSMNPNIYVWRLGILWLSAGYVFGCAFRSFLPRIDLERVCLADSWLSSMMVGRSVATVAELCFIAQCAILLREAGLGSGARFAIIVAAILVPLVTIAEGFSWYAILSTNYLGSVVEESLWAVAGVLLVVSFFHIWPHVKGKQHHFLTAMIIFGIGFVAFMVSVDVPMYWSRWQVDSAFGLQYLQLSQGLPDIAQPCKVNFNWHVWREEIPWMTLYFSAAVWVSIALPHAPNFKIAERRKAT
jgi:hypothetical protein